MLSLLYSLVHSVSQILVILVYFVEFAGCPFLKHIVLLARVVHVGPYRAEIFEAERLGLLELGGAGRLQHLLLHEC